MNRVHSAIEAPVGNIRGVAVFVSSNRRHIGLVYQITSGTDSNPRVLHLGWHGHGHFHDDTNAPDCAFWVDPDIEPEQSEVVSAYCRLIFEQNRIQGIPYGFGSPEGFFGRDGGIFPTGARLRLTCATFVLAVFHLSGIPLVKYSTWVTRPDDYSWQEWILQMLRRSRGVSQEHVQRNAALIAKGQARFRPVEVAGAVASNNRPVDFDSAVRMADKLMGEFDRIEFERQAPPQ